MGTYFDPIAQAQPKLGFDQYLPNNHEVVMALTLVK